MTYHRPTIDRLLTTCGVCVLGAWTLFSCDDSGHDGHDHTPVSAASLIGESASPVAAEDWCFEHGVPEAVCTRCNPALIDEFKKSRDWCGGHGLPESQCVLCNPEVEAHWAAMRPAGADLPKPAIDAPIKVERISHPLRPVNSPVCDVESSQIRLIDAGIAAKAGIDAEPAQLRRMSTSVDAFGEVRYDQTRFARITPRVPGLILEVPVNVGNQVQPGDVIAVLESVELGQAKSAYVNARESWLLANSDLERHHHIHDAIETLLAACAEQTDSEELRNRFAGARIGEAKSRVLSAHAQLQLTRGQFEREKKLLEGGITSQDAFQTAHRNLVQAEADFAATKEAIDLQMEKEHLALARTVNVAQIEMDAARRQIEVLGIDAQQVAALDAGRVEALSRYELRSPIAGRVVSRSAVVGEAGSTDNALFSIADLTTVWLLVSLEEDDLAAANVGDRLLFTPDALPGQSFESALEWISAEVDDRTRTVEARAAIDNRGGFLRPNMFGRVRLVTNDAEELLTIPQSAVQTDGCCNIVFVKETDTLFRPRKIAMGSAASGYIQILDGVTEGQMVVTNGSFLLKTEILKSSIGAGCCEVDPGR